MPLEDGRTPIRLVQIDVDDGQVRELKLPPHAIEAIVNNTWEVSPDGKWLVFQSATDGNLWLVRLPSEAEGA
jgi:Tol biopolymer transport system component